eukprot:TRINITY_DN5208_c0_g1_i1.p1 TRINITY_DN5208_c0_g1~~TRINITY_DN5208_c0_g1_i1.p1  ORF type:complete len:2117 (-),score=738.52 TRINITY_DN5208_c0_g1_i1:380-6730(-)
MEGEKWSKILSSENEEEFNSLFNHSYQELIDFVPNPRKKSETEKMANKHTKSLIEFGKQMMEWNPSSSNSSFYSSLIQSSMQGFEYLDKLKSALTLKGPFDLETMRFKVANKCSSLKRFDLALIICDTVEKKLIEFFNSKTTSSSLLLPPKRMDEKHAFPLILNTLVLKISCKFDLDDLKGIELILTNQILPWIDCYMSFEAEKGIVYLDKLMQRLYKLASLKRTQDVKRIASMASSLLITKLSYFPIAFCDQLFKSASHFDSAGSSNPEIKEKLAVQLYEEVFGVLDRMKDKTWEEEFSPSFSKCVYHYSNLLLKGERCQESISIAKKGIQYLESLKKTKKELEPIVQIHKASLLFVLSHCILLFKDPKLKMDRRLQNFQKEFEEGIDLMTKYGENLDMDQLSTATDSEPDNYGLIMKNCRRLYEVKRSLSKEKEFKAVEDECGELLVRLIEKGQKWDSLFLKSKLYSKAGGFDALNTIKFHVLSSLSSSDSKGGKGKEILQQLEKSSKKNGGKDLVQVAKTYQERGYKLYRDGKYDEAIKDLQHSIKLTEEFVGDSEENFKVSGWSRKYELLSICYAKKGERETAFEMIKMAVKVHDNWESESRMKILEQYCISRHKFLNKTNQSLDSYDEGVGLFEVLESISFPRALSQSEISSIIEDEFSICIQLGGAYSIRFLISILEKLNELYEEDKMALKRVSILVEKAKLVRIRNPENGNEADPSAALELLEEANQIAEENTSIKTSEQLEKEIGKKSPTKILEICIETIDILRSKRTKGFQKQVGNWLKIALSSTFLNSSQISQNVEKRKELASLSHSLREEFEEDEKMIEILDEFELRLEEEWFLLDQLASLSSWLGVVRLEVEKQYDPKPFRSAIAIWNELYTQIISMEENSPNRFRCFPFTVSSIKTMADFLGFVEDYPLQIHSLKLLIGFSRHIGSIVSPLQSHCDIAEAMTKIASIYREMGYSSRSYSIICDASSSFAEAEEKYAQRPKEESAESMKMFHTRTKLDIEMGYNLLQRGDLKECAKLIESPFNYFEDKKALSTQDHQTFALIKSLKSSLALKESNSIEALSLASEAFNMRRGCLNFLTEGSDSSNEKTSTKDSSSALISVQWSMRKELVESHLQISHLSGLLGDSIHSLYHARKGAELIFEMTGTCSSFGSSLCMERGDLLHRMKREKEAKELFDLGEEQLKGAEEIMGSHSSLFLSNKKIRLAFIRFDSIIRSTSRLAGEEGEEEAETQLNEAQMLISRQMTFKSLSALDKSTVNQSDLPTSLQKSLKTSKKIDYSIPDVTFEVSEQKPKKGTKVSSSIAKEDCFGLESLEHQIYLRRGIFGLVFGKTQVSKENLQCAISGEFLAEHDLALAHYLMGRLQFMLNLDSLSPEIDSLWISGFQKEGKSIQKPSKDLESTRKSFSMAFEISKRLKMPYILSEGGKILATLYGPQKSFSIGEEIEEIDSVSLMNLTIGSSFTNRLDQIKLAKEKEKEKKKKGNSVDELSDLLTDLDFDSGSSLMNSKLEYSSSFFRETIDSLPETWNVISISLVADESYIVITRSLKDSQDVIVRVPLSFESKLSGSIDPHFDDNSGFDGVTFKEEYEKELAKEQMEEEASPLDPMIKCISKREDNFAPKSDNRWSVVFHRFRELLQLAEKNRAGTDCPPSKWAAHKQNREWLDRQLSTIVNSLESSILGFFKVLLVGDVPNELGDKLRSKAKELEKQLSGLLPKTASFTLDSRFFQLVFCGLPSLLSSVKQNEEISLEDTEEEEDEEDRYYLLKKALCFLLRWDLDELNSKQEGKIIDLCESFESEYCSILSSERLAPSKCQKIPTGLKLEGDPIIMILDKQIQSLPWESTRMLQNQQVTRLPSFTFFKTRTNESEEGVDARKTFYILNPSKELLNLQNHFEPFFRAQSSWRGVIKSEPTHETIRRALLNDRLFIYCGHGGGEQYYPGELISKMEKASPVSLLMGCSSGALREYGDFEPFGNVANYLLNGCPSIVGNLWDVSDREINRFTSSLMHSWFKGNESLPCAAAKARQSCLMRFLVGSAPIVYGFPVFVQPFHCKNVEQLVTEKIIPLLPSDPITNQKTVKKTPLAPLKIQPKAVLVEPTIKKPAVKRSRI